MSTRREPKGAGRRSLTAEMADKIRSMLTDGQVAAGSFLPTERDLAARYRVSRVTARRALKQLVSESLIEAVPSQGYRPVTTAAKGGVLGPVAYVLAVAETGKHWDRTHEQILSALNSLLLGGGRHAVAIGAKGRSPAQVMCELRETGAWGIVLDTSRDDFIKAAAASQMPCVIVDAHSDLPDMDVVIQDNFNGARRAVEWLIASGHRRIAWVGPRRELAHYRERFSGAEAAMRDAGLEFESALIAEVPYDSPDDAREAAGRMLAMKDRPEAFVCMWLDVAVGVVRAIRDARLKPGTDVAMAAWSTEREYREMLAPEFLGSVMPVTATWRPEEMAELALSRLEWRAANPSATAARIDVRVRLAEPRPAEQVIRKGGSAS